MKITRKYTADEVRDKYKNKYISITKSYDYQSREYLYEINKVYSEIHEDTTRGEDVGTSLEYMR